MKELSIMIYLVPNHFRKTIVAVRNAGISLVLLAIMWILYVGFSGGFSDLSSAILYSLTILTVASLSMIPGIRYYKVSQSTVLLTPTQIRIVDKSGSCWREIDYTSISKITVENIAGFFYGKNNDNCVNKYICIYLNELATIPNVTYHNLYTHRNFIIISYQEHALSTIKECMGDKGTIFLSPDENRP